jgi:WD40 repeat protein
MRIAYLLGVLVLACSGVQADELGDEPELVVQGGPRREVRVARIAPDGNRLAILDGALLQLWTRGGALLWSRSVAGDARALAWSRDGKSLAVGLGGVSGFTIGKAGDSAGAMELDARDGRVLRRLLNSNNTISDLEYLSDGRLVARSDDGAVAWNNASQKTALKNIWGQIVPTPDGTASAVLTRGVQLWDGSLKTKTASLWRKGMPTQTLAWSRDGKRFAVGDARRIQIWSVARRLMERDIVLLTPASAGEYDATCLAWSPDGKTLVVARTDFPDAKPDDDETGEKHPGRPRLWLARIETASGKLTPLRAHERRAITSLDFWPDATLIWGGASNYEPPYWSGELYFMRLESAAVKPVWSAPQPLEAPSCIELSPDGSTLAIGGDDTAVRLWSLSDGRLEKTLKEVSAQILALSWSPSGQQLAALDYQSLLVFDVASGRGKTFKGTDVLQGLSPSIAWSPDEKQIAFDGGSGTTILDLSTKKARELIRPGEEEGMGAVFGPLRWTRSGLEAGGGVMLVNPQSGRVLRVLDATGVASEPGHNPQQFFWMEGGRKLLTLGSDTMEKLSIKRWGVAGNRVERTLDAAWEPSTLALAPDEKSFAVGGEGGELALYDTQTFAAKWTRDTGSPISALVWSGSGDVLFVAAADGWTAAWSADGVLQSRLAALPSARPATTGYEWIHIASDERYVASSKAASQVRWRSAGAVQALESSGARAEALPLSNRVAARPFQTGLSASPTVFAERPTLDGSKEETDAASGHGTFPKLVLQGEAAGQFRALAVSPRARWIVSHNEDQSVTLWDGKSGLQWGEIQAARDRVPLFFSPDGSLLFCAPTQYSGDGEVYKTLEVRRMPGGELARSLDLQAPFWSDGKIARGLHTGAVETWDIASGKRMARSTLAGLPADLPASREIAFSPDGALLVAGADYYKDRAARAWRIRDGVKIIEIKDPKRIIGPAAVSSDGRFLGTEGEDPGWSPPTDGPMTEASYARTFRIHLWNARTRKLLHTYEGYYSLSGGVQLLRFSPDGKWLLSAGKDGHLRRLEVATGRVADIPPTPKDQAPLLDWPIALSPDALVAAGQVRAGALSTLDVTSGRLGRSFPGPLAAPGETFCSPDGRYLFGNGNLFDAHSGAFIASASGAYVREVAWHGDEIWTANLGSVTRWKLPTLQKIAEWRIGPSAKADDPSDDYSDGVRLSPDGRTVLTTDPKGVFGGGKKGLWVWDALTHKTRRTLIPDFEHGFSDLDRLVFFPRGDKILRPTQAGMELWNLTSGQREKSWRDPIDPKFEAETSGGTGALLPLAVSPDEKLIAARATRNETIWIFDTSGQSAPVQLLIKAGYRAQFLKDAHTLLAQSPDGWQFWDARGNGRAPLKTLGVSGQELHLSPDEKLATHGAGNKGLQIWNIAQNAESARIYLITAQSDSLRARQKPPGWLVFTPQGFYNASSEGEKRMRWRDGNGFWPLEKSRAQFFRPDKVRSALAPDAPASASP